MAASLTKRSVDALTAGKREEYLWDDDIRGFGVKALPTGRKVFLLVYRYPRGRAGKVRRYTIGTYGDLTVDQARRIAVGKRGDVARGIDPMAELEQERKVAEAARKAPRRSVAHIAEEFIERYAKKRNRTWRETERILKRHIIPATPYTFTRRARGVSGRLRTRASGARGTVALPLRPQGANSSLPATSRADGYCSRVVQLKLDPIHIHVVCCILGIVKGGIDAIVEAATGAASPGPCHCVERGSSATAAR